MSESSYKKARYNINRTAVFIDGNADDNINIDVVSLIVRNNDVLSILSNLQSLSYLKLINTKISAITNCKWVTTAVIENNNHISNITSLPKLDDLRLMNCNYLELVNLENLRDLLIQNCTRLVSIKACRLITATFINCNMMMINLGTNLTKLVLNKCNQIKNLSFLNESNIDHIELTNCNQLYSINGVSKCGAIIIRECQSLITIDCNINCKLLQLDLCDSLVSIHDLVALKCDISRCISFEKIDVIAVDTLKIDYCDNIIEINTYNIKEVSMSYCNMIKKIYVDPSTEIIKLKNCVSFECFNSRKLPINQIRNVSITLIGKFAFDHLSKIFASSLTIVDNDQLYTIDTIYDLERLEIIDCPALETIENSVITDSLIIRRCKNLFSICNIMALRCLTLVNLPNLYECTLIFSPIEKVFIENCTNLTTSFSGKWIKYLTLIDTNIISLVEIPLNAMVDISNSKYLPNLSTDIYKISCSLLDSVTPNNDVAIELNKYLKLRLSSVNRIIHSIRIFQIRLLKDRLYLALIESKCSICLDEILPSDRFITKCFHTFHIGCIERWTHIDNICPLCKQRSIYIS